MKPSPETLSNGQSGILVNSVSKAKHRSNSHTVLVENNNG